jgi:hypothetical protein
MGPVQRIMAALIEWLAAGTAAETALTLSSVLWPLRNGRRAAPNAPLLYRLPRQEPPNNSVRPGSPGSWRKR